MHENRTAAPAGGALPERTRTPPTAYAAVVVPVAIVIGAVAMQPWMPPSDLLRDSQVVAAAHAEASAAYGLVSNAGVLLMALAAGGAVVGRLALRGAPASVRSLLAWSALLSLAVALDDLLLLHETLSVVAGAGAVFAALYGVAFLSYSVQFRATILREYGIGLLVLAVAAFASSIVVDGLAEPATQASLLMEDGAKLLGYVAWSAFVLRVAIIALRSGASDHSPSRTPSTTPRIASVTSVG